MQQQQQQEQQQQHRAMAHKKLMRKYVDFLVQRERENGAGSSNAEESKNHFRCKLNMGVFFVYN
jgi:hypothetical protein